MGNLLCTVRIVLKWGIIEIHTNSTYRDTTSILLYKWSFEATKRLPIIEIGLSIPVCPPK